MTNEYNPDGKEIRFIDSHYKDLFHIPDGSCVQIHYPDEMVVKPCTFIDEYHTQIGYNVFHICQFAEIMERNGASYMPEPEIMGDEAAWKVGKDRILAVQTCEDGYDYTLLDENYNEIDGGQVDNPELSMLEVRRDILESFGLERRELRAMFYEDVMEQAFEVGRQAVVVNDPIAELAFKLDRFAENFDPYEYMDQVDDVQAHIQEIKADLAAGNTAPYREFLNTYTDENGNKRQKWETFETNAEAKKRKLQVEYEQESGTFIPPSAKTVNDLLDEYMSIYGVNTWAMSTYESRKSLIANYIRPLIGDMKLEDVTPRIMDKYYRDLLSVKAVSSKYVKARTEYLTPHTVREVHKTLRNAFNQAVKWELMTRNPVEHATLPKEEHKTRDIWTAEVLQKALEACDDDILRLAINLAFSCSLRMGELLGLTWDCIDISPTSIELGQASIFVEKELQRVNREAMADLDGKDIMFKFPPTFASTHTALVLKTPKTKTSVRKVFLPKTVAEMLVQRKADIEELKDLFGDEFVDFNLVFCSSNGKPIEGQVINRAFNKLIEEKGLPKVVFHSLRHSSITYKLKLNGGDMKSVQGDSGHAQVKMVADVYSHIIDDDRRLNAERMEAAFYSGRQATPEPVQPAATESSADDKELLLKLLQNPEMAALLKSLAKTL